MNQQGRVATVYGHAKSGQMIEGLMFVNVRLRCYAHCMASLTLIDPSDIRLFDTIGRVLVVKGQEQIGCDDDESMARRKQLVIPVAGQSEILVFSDGQTESFSLTSRNQGLLINESETFRLKGQSPSSVVIIIEDGSEVICA